MSAINKDFFKGKRPWSKLLKDRILKDYLPPYLRKVVHLGKKIIIVDGFAGPGLYEDGEYGSPKFICETARNNIPDGNYYTIFANKKRRHHNQLHSVLEEYINDNFARLVHLDAESLLKNLYRDITCETLFIYLDPFGITDFEFSSLAPFLKRDIKYSTELLFLIHVPIIHRLAARNKVLSHEITSKIEGSHLTLTKTFGGEYWKNHLLNLDAYSSKERVFNLMKDFSKHVGNYLPITGFCPVYETTDRSRLVYVLFFASRHPDSALLMNDIMLNALWEYIWENVYRGTIFQSLDNKISLPPRYFEELKIDILYQLKDDQYSRLELWRKIVLDKFLVYRAKDYRKIVQDLINEGILEYTDVRGTGRLNDDSIVKRIT